jgi:hypothetical protein
MLKFKNLFQVFKSNSGITLAELTFSKTISGLTSAKGFKLQGIKFKGTAQYRGPFIPIPDYVGIACISEYFCQR